MTAAQEQLAAVKKALGLDDPAFLLVAFTDDENHSHFLVDCDADLEPLADAVANVLQPDVSRRKNLFRREYEGGRE